MRKIKANLTINGVSHHQLEAEDNTIFEVVKNEVRHAFWGRVTSIETEGQKASLNIEIALERTMNRRAPRRAPEVIEAEKAARAEKMRVQATEREAYEKKQKEEQERLRIQRRQRITNQIDYAFKSGSESGSEPVSKYITCQQCDAPATSLHLNREVPFGAAVLDESVVIGASCDAHTYINGNHNNYYGIADYVSVARLEFFYTGIRQIGIKS